MAIAYVLVSIVNVSTSDTPSSSSESLSLRTPLTAMSVGVLTSITVTAESWYATFIAYVLEPIVNMSTPVPPSSSSVASSISELTATMSYG